MLLTRHFSVSTLVTLAGLEGDKPSFESILKVQIETLKMQLDKVDSRPTSFETIRSFENSASPSRRVPCPDSSQQRDVRVLLDTLLDRPPRIYGLGAHGRDMHTLHDAIECPCEMWPSASTTLRHRSLA